MPLDDDLVPTPGATPAEMLRNLGFPGTDISGVPDRRLTPEEEAAGIQQIRDAKSAKDWVVAALGMAAKLGMKIVGA